jgi:lipoprotein signal peptidase
MTQGKAMTMPPPIPSAARNRSLLLGAGVILADQTTKLAAELLAGGQRHGPLVPVRNPHFSLGLAATTRPLMLAAMAAGIALVAAYGFRVIGHHGLPGWILSLAIGGAVSNLVDRLLLGAVRDFLAIGHIVINLADLAVVAGVLGFCLTRRPRPPATSPPPETQVSS